MARKWSTIKIINGKPVRYCYAEWSYIGGSVMQTVTTESIDEADKKINVAIQKDQGAGFEQSKK